MLIKHRLIVHGFSIDEIKREAEDEAQKFWGEDVTYRISEIIIHRNHQSNPWRYDAEAYTSSYQERSQ